MKDNILIIMYRCMHNVHAVGDSDYGFQWHTREDNLRPVVFTMPLSATLN